MSDSGVDEAQFVRDTADCLSRSVTAVGVDQGGVFVFCMKGRGWEEQVSVGAPGPAPTISGSVKRIGSLLFDPD